MKSIEQLRKDLNEDMGNLSFIGDKGAISPIHFTHAMTLTFNLAEKDRITAESTFRVFVHNLNEKVFRKLYKKKNKRLKLIATIEGEESGKRLHYHVAIEVPVNISEQCFKNKVQLCWDNANRHRETYYSLSQYAKKNNVDFVKLLTGGLVRNNIVDIDIYKTNGWIGYIGKELTKLNSDCLSEHCYF